MMMTQNCESSELTYIPLALGLGIDPSKLPGGVGLSREEVERIVEEKIQGISLGGSRILWESDWFDIKEKEAYNFLHGLAIQSPEKYDTVLVAKFKVDEAGYKAGDIIFLGGGNFQGGSSGLESGYVIMLDENSINVAFGQDIGIGHCHKDGGYGGIHKRNVQCKAIIRG